MLGSYEIVQYGFGLVVCLSVAYASIETGQIVIDLLFGKFPKRLQRLFTAVSEILAVFMFALIVWRLGAAGVESFRISERSLTFQMVNVYIIGGIAKDVPLSTIFRGIMPSSLPSSYALS